MRDQNKKSLNAANKLIENMECYRHTVRHFSEFTFIFKKSLFFNQVARMNLILVKTFSGTVKASMEKTHVKKGRNIHALE